MLIMGANINAHECYPNLRDLSDGGHGLLIIPKDFVLPPWETLFLYDARSH